MFSYTFMNFECIFYTSSFRSLHLHANQREKDRHSAINTEAERKNRLWNRKNKTREIYASAELNNRASSAREIINSLQMGINLPFKSFVNCDRVDMIARLLWIFFRLFSNDDDDDDSVTRSFAHSTNYCFFFSSSFIWLVHRMSVSLGSDVCIFIKTQSFCSSCCCCCCVLLFSCLFLYIAINIAWLHSARVCVCLCSRKQHNFLVNFLWTRNVSNFVDLLVVTLCSAGFCATSVHCECSALAQTIRVT